MRQAERVSHEADRRAAPLIGSPFVLDPGFGYTVTINLKRSRNAWHSPTQKKQRAYRQRHLGRDGEKARIQLFLSATTRAQLNRLARHNGYTVTALIEELAASAERRTVAKLTGKALKEYYDGWVTA